MRNYRRVDAIQVGQNKLTAGGQNIVGFNQSGAGAGERRHIFCADDIHGDRASAAIRCSNRKDRANKLAGIKLVLGALRGEVPHTGSIDGEAAVSSGAVLRDYCGGCRVQITND